MERGYYSEDGHFLPQLEDHRYTAEPLTTDATTTIAAVVQHNTNCTINMHTAFHLGGSTPPWATGAATTQWLGATGPGGDEGTGAEELKDSEADFGQRQQLNYQPRGDPALFHFCDQTREGILLESLRHAGVELTDLPLRRLLHHIHGLWMIIALG